MMKICKITINNFGKIKNETIDTSSSFNKIIKDNGEGKSTLFNFIYAMFYGVGRNSKKELRGLYIPWDNSSASGSIEFEHDNVLYKLERTFAKTQRNDEAHLYNLSTGKEEFVANNEYGKHFFNLQEDAFKSTLFITNKDIVVNASTNLNNILVNTINTGDAATSFENANDRLSEFSKIIDENSRHSQAILLLKEKDELVKKYLTLEQENQKVNSLLLENESLINNKNNLIEKETFYKEVIKYNEDKKHYNDYMHYLSLKEKKDSIDNNKTVNKDYDKIISQLEEINNKKSKKVSFIPLILDVLFLVPILFIENATIDYILIGLCVISLILFLIMLFNTKKYNEKLIKEKEDFNYQFGKVKSYDAALLYINNMKEKDASLQHNNNEIIKLYVDFLEKHDINKLSKYSNFQIIDEYEKVIEPEKQLELLNSYKHEIDTKLSKNEGILSTIDNSATLAMLKSKIDVLNETLIKYRKYKEAFLLSKSLILESKEEVFNNFTPQLRKHLSDVLEKLSNGKFVDILIDSELNINLDEGKNLHSIDFYSQGYKDLVYLALRIAIIKMALNKSLPIFLDDPLVNLDKKNKANVINYLNDLSKENQIFYFSCTNID